METHMEALEAPVLPPRYNVLLFLNMQTYIQFLSPDTRRSWICTDYYRKLCITVYTDLNSVPITWQADEWEYWVCPSWMSTWYWVCPSWMSTWYIQRWRTEEWACPTTKLYRRQLENICRQNLATDMSSCISLSYYVICFSSTELAGGNNVCDRFLILSICER